MTAAPPVQLVMAPDVLRLVLASVRDSHGERVWAATVGALATTCRSAHRALASDASAWRREYAVARRAYATAMHRPAHADRALRAATMRHPYAAALNRAAKRLAPQTDDGDDDDLLACSPPASMEASPLADLSLP